MVEGRVRARQRLRSRKIELFAVIDVECGGLVVELPLSVSAHVHKHTSGKYIYTTLH